MMLEALTTLDMAIIVVVLVMAMLGLRQGFVAGALSLAGLVIGAVVASRLAPQLLPRGTSSPYAPLFGLVGGLCAAMLVWALLQTVGLALRRRVRIAGGGGVDALLGALLTAVVGLGLVWISAAALGHLPATAQLRSHIQSSVILRNLNERLPPSGSLLNAIARYDPFPQIDGPPITVAPPDDAVPRDPEVRRAAASVVRVLGTACGLGISGTGWAAGNELVVTNAHVVAGQRDTAVQIRGRGRRYPATTVVYDTRNDIAVLLVQGLALPGLALDPAPRFGESSAVLGFPNNGAFDVRAARVGRTQTVLAQDSYGRGPLQRSVTSFRGLVRQGNSGGPVVDGDGQVVTTVFAATVDASPRGGYGVPNDVVADALAAATRTGVDTGPCVA